MGVDAAIDPASRQDRTSEHSVKRHGPIAVQSGFSRFAEALADPAREAIVCAVAGGKALPAGELAVAAGISPQSATAHLQKLVDAKILAVWPQGRFRYYQITDDDVALLVESLINFAAKAQTHERRGARLPLELRQSRTCYRHLAGQLGVALAKAVIGRGYVSIDGRSGSVTDRGLAWCRSQGIDIVPKGRSSVRLCMDWTERQPHLAGAFPNTVLRWLIERKLLRAGHAPRALSPTPAGRIFFKQLGIRVDF
jgi:DNA-binding transcriptional ArsR family regulator